MKKSTIILLIIVGTIIFCCASSLVIYILSYQPNSSISQTNSSTPGNETSISSSSSSSSTSTLTETTVKYRKIKTFKGSGIKKTEPFLIQGDRIRVSYTAQDTLGYSCYFGGELSGVDDIFGETFANEVINDGKTKKDSSIIYSGGEKYLDVNSTCKWTVTIEDYY